MIFEVEREKLLNAVSNLSRIVSSKTSLPVLEGIKLQRSMDQRGGFSNEYA